MRLSKRYISSSIGVGGGVSIEIVVVIFSIVAAVVVVGVGVVGLRGAALFLVVSMFLGAGVFLSSASAGGSVLLRRFEHSFLLRLFLLSWSHKGLSRRCCYGW